MEKENRHSDENNQINKLNEPAIAYGKSIKLNPPCVFTDEEKKQQIEQGIEEMKKGLGYTMEEVFDRYKQHQ